MKAITRDVYGPAAVLELREVSRPSIGDGEVLVEVRAAGVDPGVWIFTFEQAAATPISAVAALQSIRDAQVRSGQRVLITGAAGGVGSFAVQLVTIRGARVTGVCSTSKEELVRSIGAEEVIDYTQHEIDCGGARYDVIIDTGRRPHLPPRRGTRRDPVPRPRSRRGQGRRHRVAAARPLGQ